MHPKSLQSRHFSQHSSKSLLCIWLPCAPSTVDLMQSPLVTSLFTWEGESVIVVLADLWSIRQTLKTCLLHPRKRAVCPRTLPFFSAASKDYLKAISKQALRRYKQQSATAKVGALRKSGVCITCSSASSQEESDFHCGLLNASVSLPFVLVLGLLEKHPMPKHPRTYFPRKMYDLRKYGLIRGGCKRFRLAGEMEDESCVLVREVQSSSSRRYIISVPGSYFPLHLVDGSDAYLSFIRCNMGKSSVQRLFAWLSSCQMTVV